MHPRAQVLGSDDTLRVKRRRLLQPVLHPRQNRVLPKQFAPPVAYKRATQLQHGLADKDYQSLVCRIDQAFFHRDTKVEMYFNGERAFIAMLSAIREATQEVLLEAYIISDDKTGHDLQNALLAAVQRGVKVMLMADAFGSSGTARSFWQHMQSAGCQVKLFRHPLYARASLLPVLDHRKLLVIDRKTAFTGGMNMADEYHHGKPGDSAWRDTHLRMDGSVAWEMAMIFDESWQAAGGAAICQAAKAAGEPHGVPTLVLDSRPGRGLNEVFSVYAATLGATRQHAWMTNAYFAPSRKMLNLLTATAHRGIDVRLMLPGRSDIPIIRVASQSYYPELLKSGIRIFEYQGSVLHAKTLVADTRAAIVGSSNFDFRSFNFNAECNVLMLNQNIASTLETAFQDDMANSREITLQDWRALSLWRRCAAWLARGFAVFM